MDYSRNEILNCSSENTIDITINYLKKHNENNKSVDIAIKNLEKVKRTYNRDNRLDVYRSLNDFKRIVKPLLLSYSDGIELKTPNNGKMTYFFPRNGVHKLS
jgi:hypothetical protein